MRSRGILRGEGDDITRGGETPDMALQGREDSGVTRPLYVTNFDKIIFVPL